MKQSDSDDKDSNECFLIKTWNYIEQTIVAHDVYIHDNIESPKAYIPLLHKLREAKPETEMFRFRLASYGGSCDGLIAIINAIRDCKTLVEMHIDSPCYSAAATLALAGHDIFFNKNTFLMFHNYSSSAYGKGQELKASVLENDKWLQEYMYELHRPFLTTDECNRLAKDQDIYIHYSDKDLPLRIKRHKAYIHKLLSGEKAK